MVVFQDAVAHPLPARNILRRFDIVRVIRNFTDKHNTGFFVQCIIGNSVSLYLITMRHQFADGILIQTAARLVPEFNRSVDFLEIIVAQSGRHSGSVTLR